MGSKKRWLRTLAGVAAGATLLAACSSSSSSSAATGAGAPSGGTKVTGGTVTWAEPPNGTPSYIFPFASSQYSTVDNISQFQYLLFRPLYMFGHPNSTQPTLDAHDSPADAPTFSKGNTQATITLKGWKWSNGESVDATDVMFWMNMMHAEKANWYDYTPGFFPDNITSVKVDSPTQVTFTFNKSYNPTWMTYNELSQITPMPQAWDITSAGAKAGSGNCATGAYGAKSTDAACTAVYSFLTGKTEAQDLSTYATNPLWQVVDGPFKLTAFNTSGDVTMVPNPTYSGPQKATISAFKEVPFTTENAEYNALLGGKLTVGYLPTTDLTANTTNAMNAGPNNPRLSGKFYMSPWILFGINYAVYKFESNANNNTAGAVFKQLYFRQAVQHLVDQSAMISKILRGYGVPTYGPVPVLPPNNLTSSSSQTNPYPYSVSAATKLLSANGWKVTPNGTDTCVKPGTGPGQCGAGIPAGTPLSFTFAYATGVNWQQQVVQVVQSSLAQAGIHLTLSPGTFNTVVGNYAPPCTSNKTCNTQIGWWGGGWEYSPDYYPTGETLFSTGAGSNAGNYSNQKADSLINATTTSSSSDLSAYQQYLAQQLPVLWLPNADYALTEVATNLRGLAPQNPFANLFPEYWYFVK